MGCDAYANKDGVFEILISNYDNVSGVPFEDKIIRIENLDEYQRIQIEIIEGNER